MRAEYDASRGGGKSRVKGNLHWVSGSTPGSLPSIAEVRLYDYLFTVDEPGAGGKDWESEINPASEVLLPVRINSSACVRVEVTAAASQCDDR